MGSILNKLLKSLIWLAPDGKVLSRITKSIPLVVSETEQLWKDKKIDVSERKIIAQKAVEIIARDNNRKLNWLAKIAISIIINVISQQLPARDINIKETLIEAVKDVKGT